MTPYDSEQKRLDAVLEKIQDAKAKNKIQQASAVEKKADVESGWKDVRFKSSTYGSLFETAMSVRQQQQMLQERELAMNSAEHQAVVLDRLTERPYFARIDVQEKGTEKVDQIYIGLASFSDGPDNFLIYDWRAPISSIYYDGGLGKVTYETPDGKQDAEVSLKRQFQIEDGKIVTIFDTDEAVGDQMLLNAVSGESTTKMKSIVTTIQKEQNKIIRNTAADLLFVQGAAGSGKTSAVLQRVAYLLYRYRGHLTSGQVVLFSPNQLFNDYIDQVLPELGEQNMVQMTFYQYASRRLPKLQLETLQERFESQPTGAAKKVIDLKGTSVYFKAMQKYAQSLNHANIKLRSVKFRGHEIISKDKIADIYYSFNDNYQLGNRLHATKEQLMKILQGKSGNEVHADWVENEVQNLSKEQYDTMLRDNPREFDSDEAEYKFIAKQLVMRAFTPVIRGVNRNHFININEQFVHFLKTVPQLINLADYDISDAEWQAGIKHTVEQMRQGILPMSDMTPYMMLFDLIKGSRGERDIRFVFIDEIQDYTPFQLAFLKFSFPKARFTMLGDLNQAIFTKENAVSLQDELSQLFDPEKSEYIELTQTYRSTQQITDFSKDILIQGAQIDAFERKGALPTISVVPTTEAMVTGIVQQLASNQAADETTAIITKTLAEAEVAYAALRDQADVTIIRTENQRLVPGTIIVPAYLAKGLEFDAVIMWDAAAKVYHGDDERQLVYTIASRAMHQLTIFAVQELTPLLANVADNLYEMR
ncbi:RNA polymerase recycling motor HelD [Weissella paramesenteroides]|uniref:RNA polymerase recycling motor HelD n=1 Tax=Weissella paramesenteroides TaxID=1249 RepID=UPI00123A787B|nr:RNA polymerase recycling motor HelD [Weissella paramesenteroides]KAA8456429.1 AAA family ATPase [Weissella paramesenteroides]KAA8456627.1 AAA family ATPase [Weissella paramesenteroides]KAA8459051.1 AAA family ATPase [Weissella paramesenteroides]KAA8463457.1 AAA family ATPase [Weissella paramesenteroides]KAA8465508.1 AAA family ATPase [Weissella paramesenteroides]